MPKFITEEILKTEYRKNPFTKYRVKKGSKFTPGAKEFIFDKKIKIEFQEEQEKRRKSYLNPIIYKMMGFEARILKIAINEKNEKNKERLVELSEILKNIWKYIIDRNKILVLKEEVFEECKEEFRELNSYKMCLLKNEEMLNLYIIVADLKEFLSCLFEKLEKDEVDKNEISKNIIYIILKLEDMLVKKMEGKNEL